MPWPNSTTSGPSALDQPLSRTCQSQDNRVAPASGPAGELVRKAVNRGRGRVVLGADPVRGEGGRDQRPQPRVIGRVERQQRQIEHLAGRVARHADAVVAAAKQRFRNGVVDGGEHAARGAGQPSLRA